jgi:hypothetical protein
MAVMADTAPDLLGKGEVASVEQVEHQLERQLACTQPKATSKRLIHGIGL